MRGDNLEIIMFVKTSIKFHFNFSNRKNYFCLFHENTFFQFPFLKILEIFFSYIKKKTLFDYFTQVHKKIQFPLG